MTDFQVQSPEPLPYWKGRSTSRRPASVTTLSVFGLIFGGIGLALYGETLASIFVNGNAGGSSGGPSGDLIFYFTVVDALVQFGISILLLIGSVQALRLRPTGRAFLLACGIIQLIITAVEVVVLKEMVYPGIQSAQGLSAIFGLLFIGIYLVITACRVLFAVLLIVFMTRPRVKAAFVPMARLALRHPSARSD